MKRKNKSNKTKSSKKNKDWEMTIVKIEEAFQNQDYDLKIDVDQFIENNLPTVGANYTTITISCCTYTRTSRSGGGVTRVC